MSGIGENEMRWFKFNRKTSSEIAVGSLWTLKQRDPFKARSLPPAKVLAVKDGWVQYWLSASFPDQRMKVDSFLQVYEPK
jgi:hypothetical protein